MYGMRERRLYEQENIIRVAYLTAGFTNSKNKPKPLDYYITKLREDTKAKVKTNNAPDGKKADTIEKQIEILKNRK
ncbi:MAG TPA: hypothetical protein PLG34_13140 [Spirochaetota bacterium]|nr:hypothetical protein [Spirochaetota bacterium]